MQHTRFWVTARIVAQLFDPTIALLPIFYEAITTNWAVEQPNVIGHSPLVHHFK